MSADDRSTDSTTCCQWLDELPSLGPVTLNAFDKRLWESLLDCNGNNSQRGETHPVASAQTKVTAEEEIGERRRRRMRAAGRQHIGPSPPLHLPPAYRRQISALRQASRAYRRLQMVIGRLRCGVERRDAQNRHPAPQPPPTSTVGPEEEPDSSAMSQDDDGLTFCRNRHPPGQMNLGRSAAHLDELSLSSSWRSEISARLFVPQSAVRASTTARWLQQEEGRCSTSLAHIGATHSRSQQQQQAKMQQEAQWDSRQLIDNFGLAQLLDNRNSQVTMEFSADDSTFSYTESPIESLASLENDGVSPAAQDAEVKSIGAVGGNIKAEQPRRLILLPPAPLQTLLAPPMHMARILPTQRPRRQKRWEQIFQQQQQSQRRRCSRSCCIAIASQRLCPAYDSRYVWARRGHLCADFGCSRACSQSLSSVHDFSLPLESFLAPLHYPLLLEHVWQPAAFKQAVIDPAAAGDGATRWCIIVTAPESATVLRFVAAAGALTPEPAKAAPPALSFWKGQSPRRRGSVANLQPLPQPLYRWPPPPAGSLIYSRSLVSPSQTAATASSSSGGKSSFGGSSGAAGREKLQQQRKLRRIVQVMQMQRKPSDTDYIVAPSGGDCRSSSCRRCDLLEDLLRATSSGPRDAIGDLLTNSTRFYSFGGGEGSVADSRSDSIGVVEETYDDKNDSRSSRSSSRSSGRSSSSSGRSSRMFFITPDSVLCCTVNNNADVSNTIGSPVQLQQQQRSSHGDSHGRRRTYYARRCIVRLEESAALLVHEPACRDSSVVAACAVHQDPSDSESGNVSCSAAVLPTAQALRLRCRLQALELRTLQRAWDRPPLPPSSLVALDPTVASFIWWSLIPLGRRLLSIPLLSPPRLVNPPTLCLSKTAMMDCAKSSNSPTDSSFETHGTSAVIGQELTIDMPVILQ